jgi:hypothetical protein
MPGDLDGHARWGISGAAHNEHPEPFVWMAKAEDILENVRRARTNLAKIASERDAALVGISESVGEDR